MANVLRLLGLTAAASLAMGPVAVLVYPNSIPIRLGRGSPAEWGVAYAQENDPSSSACRLVGTTQLQATVPIYNSPQAGEIIAKFTGAPSPLVATGFPRDGATARVQVITGTGSGSFRITGYMQVEAIPIYAKAELAVVPDHLWISPQAELRVLQGNGTRLLVEKQLERPVRQSFQAWARCTHLTLEKGTSRSPTPPNSARAQVVDTDQLELFSQPPPNQSLVSTLTFANSMVLWSTERRGSWVRVQYQREIRIDAWARAESLTPLPVGEIQDEPPPPASRTTAKRLTLKVIPRQLMVNREVNLRLSATDLGPVIGVIEPGTSVYLLDVVAGWASVLPKNLHLAPPTDGQFWVMASDLGLGNRPKDRARDGLQQRPASSPHPSVVATPHD